MLAQQTLPQVALDFIISDVERMGDWFTRLCPECHKTGYVSIYPNREAEAMAYITRAEWTCKPCADVRREVDRNFYTRGGDVLVSGD